MTLEEYKKSKGKAKTTLADYKDAKANNINILDYQKNKQVSNVMNTATSILNRTDNTKINPYLQRALTPKPISESEIAEIKANSVVLNPEKKETNGFLKALGTVAATPAYLSKGVLQGSEMLVDEVVSNVAKINDRSWNNERAQADKAIDEAIQKYIKQNNIQGEELNKVLEQGAIAKNKELAKMEQQQNYDKAFAEEFIKEELIGDTFNKPLEDFRNQYTYLPQKAGQILEAGGTQLPSIYLGNKLTGGMNATTKAGKFAKRTIGTLPFMAQASGGAMGQALNEGASFEDAYVYSKISGLTEGLIESISGGIGGTVGNKLLASKLGKEAVERISKNIVGKYALKLADAGIDIAGEGFEDVLSAEINPHLKRMTYDEKAELATNEEKMQVFLDAMLTSILLKGGQAGGNYIANKAANTLNNTEDSVKNLPKMDSQTSQLLRSIDEHVAKGESIPLKGTENLVDSKNVVPELPTMVSQQAMLPTSRVEGQMAQTGNMEQMVGNVENNNILGYNNDRGVENGREQEIIEGRNQGNLEETKNERGYTPNGKRNINQTMGSGAETRLEIARQAKIDKIPAETNIEKQIEQKAKELGIDVHFFKNGNIESGFAFENGIYLDKLGKDRPEVVFSHELFHNARQNNNPVYTSEIKPIIDEFADSAEFVDVFNKFNDTLQEEIPVNQLAEAKQEIIEEIFADYTAKVLAKYDIDYNMNSNMYKRLENAILKITQPFDTADTQSAFSMPKNDVQTFASSESSRPYMDLDMYTSRDNKSQANKIGLTDIQKAINDIVTVKTGKFRQNAYGIYKTGGEIIRLKQTKDIPVALHELSHHLDKKYNLSSSDKVSKELENIAVVGENATKQTAIKEGVAEFGRYYMTDKEYAKEIAPFYYDAFERALDSDPAMKNKVENIRQMVTNYLEQSPLNRLSSNIDYGDEDVSLWKKSKDTLIKTANSFRKNFVDDLDPLKKIVNEISGDKKLMTEQDAYKLLRLNNGVTGKVQVALEYGVLNNKGEKVSKSLKEILEPVSSNQKEFVAYLTALRANDLQNRGIESGMLSNDISDVIKMYKDNETFNSAAKELYNFQNKILEATLVDSGIITKDALDAYNKNNPHYVPFYRVMDENFKQSKSSKSKKPMKIKGSTRDIINPLESIIKNTYSYMQMAERNDTFKVLFDMANKYDGTGKWFDKVPTDMMGTKVTAEDVKGILEQLNLGDEDVNYNEIFTTLFKPANNQKGNIVTVMEKGKPVHYEINDKELFDILSPAMKGENIIVKLLSPASKALRVGATHTPEFVLRNPLRDTMDAGIYSKNGFIPFVDTIRGVFDVAGRSDLYYKWLQSGGSGSTYTNAQRPVLQKTLKGLTQGTTNEKDIKTALKGAVEIVKHPLRTYLDVAGTISNVAEEATRLGEFKRALEKGKSEKTAALDSREITLDFSRGGKVAKDINKVVAFFNAELQGLDKMFTSFKDRPLATTMKGIAYLTIPAMILRALQDEEELEKVPQWEKDEFFIIFAGDTPIKIPKPQGLGQLFATFPERIVDFIRTKDKDAFDGLAQRLVTSYVPIDSTTSIFPNLFLPLIENSANYSFFRQQPIVNQSLQNRSPRYQYDENTSTIAKSIGNIFNVSPKKIDNLISGYFGNLGKDVANLAGKPIDWLREDEKDKEYKSLNAKLKEMPLVKGFVASDYASKTLDKFYENKNKASTDYADIKFKYSDSKMTATQEKTLQHYKEINSLYNKAYNAIKDVDDEIDKVSNGIGTDKYKQTKIEQLRKQKDKIAQIVEEDAKKLKAKNKLITEAERKNKLKK